MSGPLSVTLIRHGRTGWNEEGRIQGWVDARLSPGGRAALAGRRLPGTHRWWCSPLVRAVETAALLGVHDARRDRRLMEMHWGRWQGRTRRSLLSDPAIDMPAMAAAGPRFRPPGGETPLALQARFLDWLVDCARDDGPAAAVTHKGVIKGALGLAFDWDLTGKSPVRLDWEAAHRFAFVPADRRLELVRANIPLDIST